MNKGIKTLKLHASVWFKEEKGSRAETFSAIKATQLKKSKVWRTVSAYINGSFNCFRKRDLVKHNSSVIIGLRDMW